MKWFLTVLAFMLLVVPISYGASLNVSWDYDTAEAERVSEFRLYFSETAGGPYDLLLSIPKEENKATYTQTVPKDTLAKRVLYFVMRAYGPGGESDNSNEVMVDLRAPSVPFNLIINLVE